MWLINRNFVQAALVLACFAVPGLSQAADGRVTRALGDSTLVRGGGAEIKAVPGIGVNAGDEMRTGDKGQVYWQMADDSKFAIRRDSSFQINSFAPRTSQSDGNAVFSFIKGAFRTVSGLIGKVGTDNYQISTPVATMGIRGTDYGAVMKKGGSTLHPDGLYVHVYKGKIFVKNNGGLTEFSQGETGYVANINTKPVLMLGADEIFDMYVDGSIFEVGFDSEINFPRFGINGTTQFQFNQRIEPPEIPASPS